MRVEVRLEEATPITGGLVFYILSDPEPPLPGWKKARMSLQGRGRGRDDRGKKRNGKKRR
jgi:ribonuclease R